MFFRSPENERNGLKQDLDRILAETTSDKNLSLIVTKFGLFESLSDEDLRVRKLQRAIQVRIEDEDYVPGAAVVSNIFLKKEDSKDIGAISEELLAPFRSASVGALDEFVTKPYDGVPYKRYVVFGSFLRGLILITLPLILLWEIPNLFFSGQTRTTVFEPIRADWDKELAEAKLRGNVWDTLQINVRYSLAFLMAIFQKSIDGVIRIAC
jgi:hypothetical protein